MKTTRTKRQTAAQKVKALLAGLTAADIQWRETAERDYRGDPIDLGLIPGYGWCRYYRIRSFFDVPGIGMVSW